MDIDDDPAASGGLRGDPARLVDDSLALSLSLSLSFLPFSFLVQLLLLLLLLRPFFFVGGGAY